MKHLIKLSIFSAFVVFGLFSLTAKTNLVNAESAEKMSASRTLYIRNCARCHGADGRSDNELGRSLETPAINGESVARTIRVVTNGEGQMPGFKKKLTKAQITSIANYVKNMK